MKNIDPVAFQAFANERGAGYLKTWKAISMVLNLQSMPWIWEDRDRLHNYVRRCLIMEGFTPLGVEQIVDEFWKVSDAERRHH